MEFELNLSKTIDRLVNTAILGAAIFIIPTLGASIARAKTIGWQPAFNLYLVLLGIIITVYLFRKHISLFQKTILFLVIFLFFSLFEIVAFNMVMVIRPFLTSLALPGNKLEIST